MHIYIYNVRRSPFKCYALQGFERTSEMAFPLVHLLFFTENIGEVKTDRVHHKTAEKRLCCQGKWRLITESLLYI